MTIKEYKVIHNLNDLYEGEELEKQLLKWLNKDNPKITLKEAQALLLNYYEDVSNRYTSLVQTFIIDGVEYGINPDFDNITVAEFLDIDNYEKSKDNIHRLMAVLYRPVTKRVGKYYEIEPYEGSDKYCDIMEDVDVRVYFSAVNFFLALYTQLLKKGINTCTVIKGKETKRE